ncbi:MAG: hydrogenase [Microscillaceae bacterium]|jgi:putative membrane protein|nr:hydrogenase [Microscillaceae bacterium]
MLVRRNFSFFKVLSYIWQEVLYAALVAGLAYILISRLGYTFFILPFAVLGILGTALAIFLGFRNNSSYGRWWEARQLWGGIINSSRVLARLVITFTDSHVHQPNYEPKRSENFKKTLIYKQIAWVHALRIHLRKQTTWEEIRPFLSEPEFAELSQAQNKPNYLQLQMGRQIYEAMANGTLAGFDSFQIEGQLLALANYQGGCERIKNTPMLRQYDFFTRVFIFIFISLLPFSIIDSFKNVPILVIPFSVLIAFVFITINKVGVVNENPFENRVQDVPLTALCNTIERDLREALGETQLPAKLEPVDGILF